MTGPTLKRGAAKSIFTEGKYVCVGPQAQRYGRGVRDSSYHERKMVDDDWGSSRAL